MSYVLVDLVRCVPIYTLLSYISTNQTESGDGADELARSRYACQWDSDAFVRVMNATVGSRTDAQRPAVVYGDGAV